MNRTVVEIECKTILNKSTMGFSDYTLNAYLGCAFACSYCYVPIMRARRGQIDSDKWGSWMQVKTNAPEVLKRQLEQVAPNARISIGTATDSWQPIEKKYRIARRILEELSYYPNPVHLLTRSPLLMRDIDILVRFQSVRVGVSLPTFDERIRKTFEPFAPSVASRTRLLQSLVDAGLHVMLFWCPILPGVMDRPENVREYIRRAASLKVNRIVCGTFGYSEELMMEHRRLIDQWNGNSRVDSCSGLSLPELRSEITRWADYYGVNCRL